MPTGGSLSFTELSQDPMDWHAAVHGVAKGQTGLYTELN